MPGALLIECGAQTAGALWASILPGGTPRAFVLAQVIQFKISSRSRPAPRWKRRRCWKTASARSPSSPSSCAAEPKKSPGAGSCSGSRIESAQLSPQGRRVELAPRGARKLPRHQVFLRQLPRGQEPRRRPLQFRPGKTGLDRRGKQVAPALVAPARRRRRSTPGRERSARSISRGWTFFPPMFASPPSRPSSTSSPRPFHSAASFSRQRPVRVATAGLSTVIRFPRSEMETPCSGFPTDRPASEAAPVRS